jgi:glc operon protein GlcG
MKQIDILNHADALLIVNVIRTALEEKQLGASVSVVDEHGEVLAFLRTDGCPLPSIQISLNKAYTSARERSPSGELGKKSRAEGFPLTNFGDLRYVGWGGGLPIMVGGRVIGAVGVSGLPEADDIVIAQKGVEAFLKTLA